MIKILNVEVENLENAGCNNGNYPHYEITYDSNGKTATIEGIPFRFKGKLNLNDWSSFTTTVDNKEYHINAQISRSPIDWGIDCGRIAKLEVFDLIKDKRVIAYCKGDWCQYPRTKSERKLYNAFIKKYN